MPSYTPALPGSVPRRQRGPAGVCVLARSPGRPAHVRSGSSWTSRQDRGEMPSQAARVTGSLRSGCRAMLPLRQSLPGVDATFLNVLTWGWGLWSLLFLGSPGPITGPLNDPDHLQRACPPTASPWGQGSNTRPCVDTGTTRPTAAGVALHALSRARGR